MRSTLLPAAVIAGVAAAVICASYSAPAAHAQTRLTVPGAGPLYFPKVITALPVGRFYLLDTREEGGTPLSVLAGYDLLNHMVGENWFGSGTTAQVVNYPASIGPMSGSLSAPFVDDGVEMGRSSLDQQIKNAASGGNPVVIAALSEGTLVVNRELAHLATDPDGPPPDSLSFVIFSSPELGLAKTYWPDGLTVPLIRYTPQGISDSQYDVSVVFHQYEFWADPPDRPWNLVADVNSLVSMAYFHNNAAMAELNDTVEVSSKTSELGGTTTTRMIPSATVPLLKPLQQLGVPDEMVDALNSRLKPIVDAGYSRLTPDAGPRFAHGQLVGLPASARVPNSALSVVNSLRDSDNRRAIGSAGREETPNRTTPDRRAAPLRVLTHVVDGVKKRLRSLAGGANERGSSSGEPAGAPGSVADDSPQQKSAQG